MVAVSKTFSLYFLLCVALFFIHRIASTINLALISHFTSVFFLEKTNCFALYAKWNRSHALQELLICFSRAKNFIIKFRRKKKTQMNNFNLWKLNFNKEKKKKMHRHIASGFKFQSFTLQTFVFGCEHSWCSWNKAKYTFPFIRFAVSNFHNIFAKSFVAK